MMNSNSPLIVEPTNLSYAWSQLFLRVIGSGSTKASTVLLSLRDFRDGEAIEDLTIREALDDCLLALSRPSVHTVANTIFLSIFGNELAAIDMNSMRNILAIFLG
ncbi:MAG: hypothetical protein HC780_00365 [Leptolyngbyaceae cyanobacterium CSU_1_3]|nr:hypothetical protein [Leptolyngbyaceae cyanobacterium CSU_1_3]